MTLHPTRLPALLLAVGLLIGCRSDSPTTTPTVPVPNATVTVAEIARATATETVVPSATSAESPTVTISRTPEPTGSPTPNFEGDRLAALRDLVGFPIELPEGAEVSMLLPNTQSILFEGQSIEDVSQYIDATMVAAGYALQSGSDPAGGSFIYGNGERTIRIRISEGMGRIIATFAREP